MKYQDIPFFGSKLHLSNNHDTNIFYVNDCRLWSLRVVLRKLLMAHIIDNANSSLLTPPTIISSVGKLHMFIFTFNFIPEFLNFTFWYFWMMKNIMEDNKTVWFHKRGIELKIFFNTAISVISMNK